MKTQPRLVSFAVSYLGALLLFVVSGQLHAQVTSGSGTSGKIPMWTGAHSQSNSVIIQKSNYVGINYASPAAPLAVTGGTGTVPSLYVSNPSGTALRANSNSGIGTYGYSISGTGMYGITSTGVGVLGYHSADTGSGAGVEGITLSNDSSSAGIYGNAKNGYGVRALSTSGYGINASSANSYGAYISSGGSDGADIYGKDWGIYVRNTGTHPAVDGGSAGTSSYGGSFTSSTYRAGYFRNFNTSWYSLYVDSPAATSFGAYVNGSTYIAGDLVVAGSKSGYVVDHMQNVDDAALEQGDVVAVAADSGAPILGEIPVPRIHRANTAYDTAVVGIVDQVTYVPSDSVRQAYETQQANDRQIQSQFSAMTPEQKNNFVSNADRTDRIADTMGTMHADTSVVRAERGRYCSVVTLGAYKAVKVDASYGAIRAGDLLTTSPHAGYAMKVSDKAAASGAVIGKALSSLSTGTGAVSVLVTLK